ncbi:MAG: hypothetical protein CMK32_09670 [Porticoccaceae bacterium]|nr:hypothetical protein [Porticoccaceae bacterium]
MVSDQRISDDDNTRLMKSLLVQLVEIDWCIGYELTEQQMVVLDDIRTKAAMLLTTEEPEGQA